MPRKVPSTGGGSSSSSSATVSVKTASITVPRDSGGRREYSETIVDTDITSSNLIITSLAATSSADENETEFIDLTSFNAVAGSGNVTFTVAFSDKHAGPIKLNYIKG